MFAFSSVIIAIAAFFIFGERLTAYHIIGIAFLISCIIIFAFSGKEKANDSLTVQGDIVGKVTPLIPIAFSLLTT